MRANGNAPAISAARCDQVMKSARWQRDERTLNDGVNANGLPNEAITPVVVYGGTREQQREVMESARTVLGTERGQQMEERVRERGRDISISINDNENQSTNILLGTVNIDPDSMPPYAAGERVLEASPERVLAHELGHEVMGDRDDGFLNMNNVNKNENPIMRELGEPRRTEY